MKLADRFVYIRNRKPQEVDELRAAGSLLIMLKDGRPVDNGVINMYGDVYGVLFCDEIRNISIITGGSESQVLSLISWDESEYNSVLEFLKESFGELTFSAQNNKLNSYAVSISEKQRIGTDVTIFDTIIPDNMIECPECGALNERNPAMPYCMECGAPLGRC